MATVSSPSDRILTDIPHLEAADLLQKFSLDSQTETTEVPDRSKMRPIPLEPIKPVDLATGTAKPFNRSATPFNPNPNASSFQNAYPTSTYYYGGYDGGSNEWNDFLRYVNPENMVHNLHQARPTSGMGQSFGYMNRMYPNNMTYGHYGNTFRSGPGYGSFGYDSWKMGRGWSVVENKYKPRGRGNGYGKENMARLNELSKGPRAKGFKTPEGSGPFTLAVKGQNLPLSENNKEDNMAPTPDKEQYNRDDFPENYSDAKFFIIKSYSEDDVHKSIKYNVWASTPNGNKKLDAAYNEAKEKPDECPVFLLFSVNTSGQFVGLAEMVGPVDFNKTVEYWQQDKWIGCFPVKWHIVKDVPNSLLRHITLESNENKPVTNSRDTQEVNLEQGIEILKIFKGHSGKTCVLDDFGFYESRQKIMQENKAKQRQSQKQVLDGKSSDSVATEHNNKDVTVGDEKLQKSSDGVLIKEPMVTATEALVQANGDVKLLEDDKSAAAVESAPRGAKPVVLSEKRVVANGVANGVASAC